MPIYCDYGYNHSRAAMWKAWSEHYRRKGASESKAWSLARKKTHTWPPK